MTKNFLARTFGLHSDNPKSKTCPELCRRIQNRKWAGLFAVVITLTVCGARAEAQQPARIPRIGILIAPSASSNSARVEAFRQRLRELGYVEGKNIVIEYRYAEGKVERLPDLAAELVRLKVDVIVTSGGQAILAAKKASATIPIVFAGAGDPVGTGLVSSLARPGGNITGLSHHDARSRWQTVGTAQGSLPQGCPGGLPLGTGLEGKPGPHRYGGCGQGVGSQTSIA